jgi:glycosyltransferase involved in cell wall biosynthesis
MKFSIITITYNRAHLIGETIQSVLNQSYSNFEYIIIDDGSTDNTEEVVKFYQEKSKGKILYFKKEKIGIPSKLRNIGLLKAKGDIITVLDSDDLWEVDRLFEIHLVFLNKKEVNFIIHNFRHFNQGQTPKAPFYKGESFFKNILREIVLSEILAFSVYSFRNKLIHEIGLFDENILEGQHDYYARVAARYKIYFLNKSLALIRRHNNNMTVIKDVIHCSDAIKTFDKLKVTKKINIKLYKKAKYLMNYKIAKHNFDNNKNKRADGLNKILNCSPTANKIYFKIFLFKYLNKKY